MPRIQAPNSTVKRAVKLPALNAGGPLFYVPSLTHPRRGYRENFDSQIMRGTRNLFSASRGVNPL